jgi:hypothetical protein
MFGDFCFTYPLILLSKLTVSAAVMTQPKPLLSLLVQVKTVSILFADNPLP